MENKISTANEMGSNSGCGMRSSSMGWPGKCQDLVCVIGQWKVNPNLDAKGSNIFIKQWESCWDMHFHILWETATTAGYSNKKKHNYPKLTLNFLKIHSENLLKNYKKKFKYIKKKSKQVKYAYY